MGATARVAAARARRAASRPRAGGPDATRSVGGTSAATGAKGSTRDAGSRTGGARPSRRAADPRARHTAGVASARTNSGWHGAPSSATARHSRGHIARAESRSATTLARGTTSARTAAPRNEPHATSTRRAPRTAAARCSSFRGPTMSTPARAAATKEAGLAGRVREQMRHTVGRVAKGQRDAIATAQCRGHTRTTRRRRVEQDEEEFRHTRLEGEGTADDVVDVGNVPRHIRSRGRHTGDTKRRTRQNRRQRHGTHEHGDGRQRERPTHTGGQPGAENTISTRWQPSMSRARGSWPQGFPQVSTGCGKPGNKDGERTDRDSPTAAREPQDAATAAPAVARKYSSTNSLTKQRHTVTGACQQPAM